MDNGKLNNSPISNWNFSIPLGVEVKTALGIVTINEENILLIRYGQDLDFTLENAKALTKVCEEIANGNKVRVLVHTGQFGQMSSETRQYLAGEEIAKHRKAVALVIDNLAHRLMAHFIIAARKKYYPTKIFSNEKDAAEWLKEIE